MQAFKLRMERKTYIKAAKKFLDLNWENQIYKDADLRYDDIAPMLGFSSYRPSLKMCKRFFGLTIVKFFKHCRVMEIKQFLAQPENSDYEMLEIARMFGHSHRRYFNILFKDVTGITPREFCFFHKHFVFTTRVTLAEYEQPETEIYLPEDGEPTFLSNFLNRQAENILQVETE